MRKGRRHLQRCFAAPIEHTRDQSLWDILRAPRPHATAERFYNLDWPFEHCADCPGDDEPVGMDPHPWKNWSISRQGHYLTRYFPLPGSRVINIVSDECMLTSMMSVHGVVAPKWQSDGFSSHVDWSRADAQGHPGSYSKAALELYGNDVVQVRSPFSLCTVQVSFHLHVSQFHFCRVRMALCSTACTDTRALACFQSVVAAQSLDRLVLMLPRCEASRSQALVYKVQHTIGYST